MGNTVLDTLLNILYYYELLVSYLSSFDFCRSMLWEIWKQSKRNCVRMREWRVRRWSLAWEQYKCVFVCVCVSMFAGNHMVPDLISGRTTLVLLFPWRFYSHCSNLTGWWSSVNWAPSCSIRYKLRKQIPIVHVSYNGWVPILSSQGRCYYQWRRKAGKLGGLSVAVLWLLVQCVKRTQSMQNMLCF